MFGWFGKKPKHEEGRRLFEAGVAMAAQYRCQEAIDLYTQSIEACENPAPYINRANLLSKRIRHYEALKDLLKAQRLDRAGEFSTAIRRELELVELLTVHYQSALRKQLIDDLKAHEPRDIAEKILLAAFELKPRSWNNGVCNDAVEYHFFNELDNIKKFEKRQDYPEAQGWIDDYSLGFVAKKLESRPPDSYPEAEMQLHMFLCVYEESDMRYLRRSMLYHIHRNLMVRDFGGMWDALNSECRGVTREAEEFLATRRHR